MEFSYASYKKMICMLKDNSYEICSYHNYKNAYKPVILRHDVDMSIEKALELAKLENDLGIKSTYFVLISSDFYNPNSRRTVYQLHKILNMGHEVGLHFDEAKYDQGDDILGCINKEIMLLSEILDYEIRTVSMHRPSKKTLDANYMISSGKVVNSYATEFFRDFKYVSDSRRNWREDVLDLISNGTFDKLHILTHPIWYSEDVLSMRDTLDKFIRNAEVDRYNALKENIRDVDEVITLENIRKVGENI